MGLDIDQWQRHGAWQIKEVIDLSIQPLETQKERFEFRFPKGTEEVHLHTKLFYYLNSKKFTLVTEDKRKLILPEDIE